VSALPQSEDGQGGWAVGVGVTDRKSHAEIGQASIVAAGDTINWKKTAREEGRWG